jgi:hypothetical protein
MIVVRSSAFGRLRLMRHDGLKGATPDSFAQKKKWAKTHRITHPKIRASWKVYDHDPVEASEGEGWRCPNFITRFL